MLRRRLSTAAFLCLLAAPLFAGSAPRVIQGKYDKRDTAAFNLNFTDIAASDKNSVHKTSTETITGFKYFTNNADFTTISVDTATLTYTTGTTLDFSSGTVDAFYASTVTASYITVTQTAAGDSISVNDGASNVLKIYDGGNVDIPLMSAARAFKATNVTNGVGVAASPTKVAFSSETFDLQGEFDSTTNNRFVATKAGYYSVDGCASSTGLGASNLRFNVFIYKNGSEHAKNVAWSTGTGDMFCCVSDNLELAANDYVEMYVSTSAAAAKDLAGGSTITFIAVEKIR